MKRLLLNAAVAAALVSAGAAHAAATQVNFGFVPFVPENQQITYAGGATLSTSTSLDFGGSTFFTNTVGSTAPFQDDSGAYSGMPGMQVFLSQSVFNYVIGQTTNFDLNKTFTTGDGGAFGSEGFYTAAFTTVTAASAGNNFLNLIFQGTVSGPNGFTAADTMLVNCNQSGGGENAANCSFTQEGPPITTQVPEPATLGLVGLSLAGLLAAGRRRRRS